MFYSSLTEPFSAPLTLHCVWWIRSREAIKTFFFKIRIKKRKRGWNHVVCETTLGMVDLSKSFCSRLGTWRNNGSSDLLRQRTFPLYECLWKTDARRRFIPGTDAQRRTVAVLLEGELKWFQQSFWPAHRRPSVTGDFSYNNTEKTGGPAAAGRPVWQEHGKSSQSPPPTSQSPLLNDRGSRFLMALEADPLVPDVVADAVSSSDQVFLSPSCWQNRLVLWNKDNI